MSEQTDTGAGPYTRRQRYFLFQFVAVTDIVLGVLIAAFGPGVVGDPALDILIMGCGGFFVLSGLGFMWWARTRFGPKAL